MGSLWYGEYPPAETIQEAEDTGRIHFWAEVDANDTTYVCDIARETDGFRSGHPMVVCELPAEYIRLPGGRLTYSEKIVPRRLRNMEGYEYLDELGFVVEQVD